MHEPDSEHARGSIDRPPYYFVLLPPYPTDLDRGAAAGTFFDWAYRDGGIVTRQMDYVPPPVWVQDGVRARRQSGK